MESMNIPAQFFSGDSSFAVWVRWQRCSYKTFIYCTWTSGIGQFCVMGACWKTQSEFSMIHLNMKRSWMCALLKMYTNVLFYRLFVKHLMPRRFKSQKRIAGLDWNVYHVLLISSKFVFSKFVGDYRSLLNVIRDSEKRHVAEISNFDELVPVKLD